MQPVRRSRSNIVYTNVLCLSLRCAGVNMQDVFLSLKAMLSGSCCLIVRSIDSIDLSFQLCTNFGININGPTVR